jgi:hypothetical protein
MKRKIRRMTEYFKSMDEGYDMLKQEFILTNKIKELEKRIQELNSINYNLRQALLPFAVTGMAMRDKNPRDQVVDGVGPYGSSLIVADFNYATKALYGDTKKSNIEIKPDEGSDPVCAC